MTQSSPTISHWTREQASRIRIDARTTFPMFDPLELAALLPGYDIWDNWLVLNEAHEIAEIEGFRILVALAAPRNRRDVTRLCYFYSNDGIHYEVGGAMTDQTLERGTHEWSGCTILRDDGTLQTFYTVARYLPSISTQLDQRLATFTQKVSAVGNGLVLQSPFYHAILATPDGTFYQTAYQAHMYERWHPSIRGRIGNNKSDNFCFRDPHFFKDPQTQKCYLLFEANTGSNYCPQGVFNRDYVGAPSYEPRYIPTLDAYKANGCVGIVELTNPSYQTISYLPPLLTTNLVTDEIERINMIVHDGSYYLFCVTRGRKMTLVNAAIQNSVFMLGFRADTLFGNYAPLNDSGVVIRQDHGPNGEASSPQNLYSFMVMPDLNVMCYANYCNDGNNRLQRCRTVGPSVRLYIEGSSTHLGGLGYPLLAL